MLIGALPPMLKTCPWACGASEELGDRDDDVCDVAEAAGLQGFCRGSSGRFDEHGVQSANGHGRRSSMSAISGRIPMRTGNSAIPIPQEMYTGHTGPRTSPREYF